MRYTPTKKKAPLQVAGKRAFKVLGTQKRKPQRSGRTMIRVMTYKVGIKKEYIVYGLGDARTIKKRTFTKKQEAMRYAKFQAKKFNTKIY